MPKEEDLRELDVSSKNNIFPDFPQGLHWFNSRPLSLHSSLCGKLTLLDFWAYSCLDCQQAHSSLSALHHKYIRSPIAFVGIHSPKLINETHPENVRLAIIKQGISRPIVHDPEKVIGRLLDIHDVPTYVLLGPKGNILHIAIKDEGLKQIDSLLESALTYYGSSSLNFLELEFFPEKACFPWQLPLKFPGRLASHFQKGCLYCSSSYTHQILMLSFNGKECGRIGNGTAGLKDGTLLNASFNQPQGMVVVENSLYIADAGNQALRKIDLESGIVTTLWQSTNPHFPCDLAHQNGVLYLALAGSGQLAAYSLSNEKLELLPHNFSQPSGLAIHKSTLFVADSKENALHKVDLKEGSMETFFRQELQHPLALLWLERQQALIIADAHNNRLMRFDTQKKQLQKLAGSSLPGYHDCIGSQSAFNEPTGLALAPDGRRIFVADTNNHALRLVDINSKSVVTLSTHD